MLITRTEQPTDIPEVRIVNELAFGQPAEADVVDRLRHAVACADTLSLVAEEDEVIVGHILFTPALIESSGASGRRHGAGAAGRAAGSSKARHRLGARQQDGLEILRDRDYPSIIVLGHPAYCPRFGFEHTCLHGLACQWEVPDEAFMVLILAAATLAGVSGEARYRAGYRPRPWRSIT